MIKILVLGFLIIGFMFVCYCLMAAAAPRTDEERRREDEVQLEYLEQWCNKRDKGDKMLNLF